MTLSRTSWTFALITIVITLFVMFAPHMVLAADASERLQRPSGCWYNFDFTRCIAVPVTLWASSAMLSMGGGILRFAGSIFDYGVNKVIINFKTTLADLQLVGVIDGGWTFFRDLANILIIGIFVFIAISLILGLKEYGQKRMIARVLIIAVLMNFSLLFTKIVIDSSNFAAYSIYAQTAKTPGGTAGDFAIADKILKPLHVTGVWDTDALARRVAQQTDGGAMKAFLFGFFGFCILFILALVILYGAFLIIARAIMFLMLMLTAPIAYASYLSPHFEASKFGWTAWWKSLINNAAFAPLLMVFMSISILVMQSASERVTSTDTFGALLNAPQQQVLASGGRVLFLYIIGTGMLFASFRLSSSLAGSISGIRAGQMLAAAPLIGGSLFAAGIGQRTLGWNNARRAQNMNDKVDTAKRKAMDTGLKSDWAAFEKLRKQKAELEKKGDRSYNALNSALGKAFANSVGLKGVGQTKGGFVSNMKTHAAEQDEKAKAMALTADEKKKMKDETEADIAKRYAQEKEEKEKAKEAAEKELAIARDSMQSAQKDVEAAKVQSDQTRAQREPEVEAVKKEIVTVTADANNQKASMTAAFERQIADMKREKASMTDSQQIKEKDLEIARREAQHQSDMKKQSDRIETAQSKLTAINTEIDRPKTEAQKRFAEAQKTHQEKNIAVAKARKDANTLASQMQRDAKTEYDTKVEKAEKGVKKGLEGLAETASEHAKGGTVGAAIINSEFKKYTAKESSSSVLKDIQKSLKTPGTGGTTT